MYRSVFFQSSSAIFVLFLFGFFPLHFRPFFERLLLYMFELLMLPIWRRKKIFLHWINQPKEKEIYVIIVIIMIDRRKNGKNIQHWTTLEFPLEIPEVLWTITINGKSEYEPSISGEHCYLSNQLYLLSQKFVRISAFAPYREWYASQNRVRWIASHTKFLAFGNAAYRDFLVSIH